MTKEFLLEAMTDIREDYIMEAEEKRKKKKKLPWKALVLAALIPLLTITAFASDFMNIRSLCSGAVHYDGNQYSDVKKAAARAGYALDVPEALDNYTFCQIQVQDVRGLDENDREALRYRQTHVTYQDASGHRLTFWIAPVTEGVSASDRQADQVRMLGDVRAEYRLDQYRIFPADYRLTPEEEKWGQVPNHSLYLLRLG